MLRYKSLDLKLSVEGADLIVRGLLFHSVGAETANARMPLSLYLERGTARSPRWADLRDLGAE